MPNISEQYHEEIKQRIQLYERRVKRLFNRAGYNISQLITHPQAKYVESFDFSKQKKLNKKIDAIMLEFERDYAELHKNASTEVWNLSNEKNDYLVQRYIAGIELLTESKKLNYYQSNLDALKAFFKSEKSFSDRIFKVSEQLRREMELHLGFGIVNGDSADTISRRIRYYLKEPEKLFRRVRDKDGDLVLSKNAKEYHPGTGKYRSSYKNAVRLTRTTINMAYREADYIRWGQLDFVIGIKIQISDQHWARMPDGDICDQVQGIYPKWFKFTGWHPQCLCFATPVLMKDEDFIDSLTNDTGVPESAYVKNVPSDYKKWISEHTDEIKRLKTTPYHIRDNFKNGKLSEGLKNISQ